MKQNNEKALLTNYNLNQINTTTEQTLNSKDVCNILQCSISTLDKMCMKNKIEYFKVGGVNSKRIFKLSEVERILNGGVVPSI